MKSVTVTAAAIALVAMAGAGAAMADPGHGNGQGRGHDDPVAERQGRGADDPAGERRGRGTDDAPGAQGSNRACVGAGRARAGYVFRGTVTTATPESVTVNLWGANKHARRALAAATPPVFISRASDTDLLMVSTPVGTRMTRNGVTGAPRVGDWVKVKYRAPHFRALSAGCPAAGTASVTVTGTPALATFAGTGVVLKRVSAWGAVAS